MRSLSTKLIVGILVSLLLTGYFFKLKKLGFDQVPNTVDIFDERVNVLVGVTFLQNHIPSHDPSGSKE